MILATITFNPLYVFEGSPTNSPFSRQRVSKDFQDLKFRKKGGGEVSFLKLVDHYDEIHKRNHRERSIPGARRRGSQK